MKKIAIILLILCVSAFAQQRIAILNTEDDGEPQLKISELSHLTDKLREIAGNVLKDRYGIMTQQSIVDKLGSRENAAKECKEASCLADLGRKLNAHYIAQGRTSRFGDNLTIKVELYNIASGLQVAIFTGDSKDVSGLVAVLYEKAPDMFKSMLGGKIPPTYPGGIGDVLIAGGGYEFAGEKSYLVNIATEPEGAVLSFNGMPNSRCTKTPCRVELAEGSVRMIANLEQYEIGDTTISIKQNNQSINIRLKANFGVLEIKPAYSDGIGNSERWSLAINDKAYSSLENRLNPGRYKVELSHECYEALSFEAGINRDKREVFNMASHVKLKMGGLALRAEQDGEPVSEPVFVNGEQVGETPFSGSVPICANIEVGRYKERVNVELKHNEKVTHTHKMPDSEARLKRMEEERKRKQEEEAERAREEARRTSWAGGGILLAGGGVSLGMDDIDPDFKSFGSQWNPINFEFYKRNLKFFRFGFNWDFGGVESDRNISDEEKIGRVTHNKINAFIRLHPANFLFLSGGAGLDYYNNRFLKSNTSAKSMDIAVVKISTPVFPVGGGICLCLDGVGGLVIEGLYNIVPLKERTAKYISINAGLKLAD